MGKRPNNSKLTGSTLQLRAGFSEDRFGKVHGSAVFVLSLGILCGLLFWLGRESAAPRNSQSSTNSNDPAGGTPNESSRLTIFAAAALRAPLERAAQEFEAETTIAVTLQFGASQTLLTNLEVHPDGDLFLPADESYLHLAREKNLIGEIVPLAAMKPVLVVRKGNPLEIRWVGDLLHPQVRIAQANPDVAAIGKVVREALRDSGHWERIEGRTAVFKSTVQEVATDLQIGAVDAGFLWRPMLKQLPDCEAVSLPEFNGRSSVVAASVLKSSRSPASSQRFLDFLTHAERGRKIFESLGFEFPETSPQSATSSTKGGE